MFQKSQPTYTPPQEDNYRAPTSHQQDEVETVVGPSVHVEGDFASEGNIIVKGIVSGSVMTSKHLQVEQGAKIFANVKAGSATISGEVKGNIRVQDKLELTSTAQVAGDIDCQILVVEAGALLLGKISMKGIEIQGVKNARKLSLRKTRESDDEMDDSSMLLEPATAL
jgi:cytoskeletal protein CcmA (bactofilin family)